jgi:hypothetical protein
MTVKKKKTTKLNVLTVKNMTGKRKPTTEKIKK